VPILSSLTRPTARFDSSAALREILTLDPVRDHQRITFLSLSQEFPWDTQRALELALFRTFCAPSISRVLVHSGEFEERPQKRYDDTEIITSEIVEHGYDSERGKRAIARMNQLHARFEISNEDFLYVLSTFTFEPIRFIDRFGYRATVEHERIALFQFWREVGKRMHIRDIPDDYQRFEAFNRSFEARYFRFSESNQRVGRASVRLMESWFPRPLRPAVKLAIYAMLDDAALSAFGFAPPPRLVRLAAERALRLRARILRHLPARGEPVLRSRVTRRTYPKGYEIEGLGPAPAPTSVASGSLRRRRPSRDPGPN
jgi:hypothetical protein